MGASVGKEMTVDGIRKTYDKVARQYADAYGDELARRPLERGLLDAVREMSVGPIADVGCGPGQVAAWLASRGSDAFGIDLSPAMIEVARAQHPGITFRVGSMTRLEDPSGSWGGAVAMYSIVHLDRDERTAAYRELGRVLAPDAPLLVSFHIEMAGQPAGSTIHLASWFDMDVDLPGFFLDPNEVTAGLEACGLMLRAKLEREGWDASEIASRRAYLLFRRRGTT
jgi:SAM-dependent methyltransferase